VPLELRGVARTGICQVPLELPGWDSRQVQPPLARWCSDAVGAVMLDLIVDRLLPAGSSITVVIDDTCSSDLAARCSGCF
jgi:hypothetical protein